MGKQIFRDLIMKKVLLTVAIYISCLPSSYALFGVGDVVSDPGSYAYYIEQIEAMTQQLEKAEEVINVSEAIDDGVQSVAGDLVGSYNRTVGLIEAMDKLVKTAEELPVELEDELYKQLGQSEEEYSDFELMEKYLDEKFKDPLSPDYDPIKHDFYLSQLLKKSAKTLLKSVAENLGKTTPRVKNLAELGAEIDNTANIKDSQDLTNRYLAEILNVITELNTTFQQFMQIKAFVEYGRGESEVVQNRLENDKSDDGGYQTSPHTKWLREKAKDAKEKNPLYKKSEGIF